MTTVLRTERRTAKPNVIVQQLRTTRTGRLSARNPRFFFPKNVLKIIKCTRKRTLIAVFSNRPYGYLGQKFVL